MPWHERARSGFSLIELLAVVLVMGILAAMVVPKFTIIRQDASFNAGRSTVNGVRAAIAAHRMSSTVVGNPSFPTVDELESAGVVLPEVIAANPWTGTTGVRAATGDEADARAVVDSDSFGWAYFVDNESWPPRAAFYANATTPTGQHRPDGSMIFANEL